MSVFKDRVAIVTGGAAGIGRALCEQLGREGSTVVAVDVDARAVQEAAQAIERAGGRALGMRVDVSWAEEVRACIDEVVASYGCLDLMFNNAGITVLGEARDLELHHWKRVMDVNLMGVIHGTTVAYAQMIRQGNGHIVNIASLAGLVPFPSSVPYTMSKHAVVGLSTALRAEGADFGVKVSVVCPAFIKTGMMDANTLVGVRREDVKARQNRWLPTADRAAEAILRGVARNREFIVFPFYARLLWWVGRLWPAGPLPLRRKMVNDFRVLRGKFNENYP